jgi:hypothetical protein
MDIGLSNQTWDFISTLAFPLKLRNFISTLTLQISLGTSMDFIIS